MTRSEIIKMARDAGLGEITVGVWSEYLERFAKAIEQHLSYDGIHTCHDECQRPACVRVREAVQAERETCAQVCEGHYDTAKAARAIRERGEK